MSTPRRLLFRSKTHISPFLKAAVLSHDLPSSYAAFTLSEESIKDFSGPISHIIGHRFEREQGCELGKEIPDLVILRNWHSVGSISQKGNGLLVGSELTFELHKALLILVAKAKVQVGITLCFAVLDPFPDQQVVWPVSKVGRGRGV